MLEIEILVSLSCLHQGMSCAAWIATERAERNLLACRRARAEWDGMIHWRYTLGVRGCVIIRVQWRQGIWPQDWICGNHVFLLSMLIELQTYTTTRVMVMTMI
ncbi:hypothetical protein BO86DRAFT_170455 [Aspergillus japonicus CBS 114.51]|uniref:Uncharacterized protein n=2 Tax=Aspergillus TaxID=5052 RepID=A0A2V5HHD2_ASPV1|nr:hypothetical protein BO86DRAFT_170455 [Aspergillus japonicus CBS 114.51]PYI23838.1 hypothetical protein BO99DRAFT_154631 [Aspergillus violaceofuscus CBS 115571]RAH79066.1 hypothetical protein BO86DRAFT_170455 [Aspergillus japonicus CBS 114.51]